MGQSSSSDEKGCKCCRIPEKASRIIIDIVIRFFSELLGTCLFIFVGCLGCVEGLGHEKGHTDKALSFGIAAFMGAQVFFRGSGGHLNPCLTLISLFFKHIKVYYAVLYIFGQILGALLGMGLIKLITPDDQYTKGSYEKYGLCTTYPNPELNLFSVIATEFFLTCVLSLIVCSLWDLRNPVTNTASLKYGLSYYSLTYAGVSYTGCSMNPARSFAPAVWNNSWKDHWVYWLSPPVAAVCIGFFYTRFYGPECYVAPEEGAAEGEERRPGT